MSSSISPPNIYDILTTTQKNRCLAAGSLIALLTPFTDTVYLPALSSVASDLHASSTDVTATVSAYMAAIGIGQLVWGPISDRYGRLPILYMCFVIYLGMTVGCALAPEIVSLIVLRTFQGFFVGCTIVTVQASIADMYDPAERGTAMGSFLAPMLIGPIIAPLIGGALADAFTWRSTFYLLLCMGFSIFIIAIICVPETHHYFASQKKEEYKALAIPKPVVASPVSGLVFLVDVELRCHYCVMASTFAAMFTSLTILPPVLAAAPYSLSPTIIGVSFLPIGVAMCLGAIVGGATSDAAAAKYSSSPTGRFVYALVAVIGCAASCVAFGLCVGYKTHLAGVLITQSLVGVCQSFYMPANLGYLSSVKPSAAGAVGALALFVCFASAGISISVSSVLSTSIGYDGYYFILAAVCLVSGVWASVTTYSSLTFAHTPVPFNSAKSDVANQSEVASI